MALTLKNQLQPHPICTLVLTSIRTPYGGYVQVPRKSMFQVTVDQPMMYTSPQLRGSECDSRMTEGDSHLVFPRSHPVYCALILITRVARRYSGAHPILRCDSTHIISR
jgi:hypothetical protein